MADKKSPAEKALDVLAKHNASYALAKKIADAKSIEKAKASGIPQGIANAVMAFVVPKGSMKEFERSVLGEHGLKRQDKKRKGK